MIKKFYELLNYDGYLCMVDLNKESGEFHKEYPDFDGHNGFDQQELKSVLINVGFNDIVSKTIFSDAKIVDDESIQYSLFLITARKFEFRV